MDREIEELTDKQLDGHIYKQMDIPSVHRILITASNPMLRVKYRLIERETHNQDIIRILQDIVRIFQDIIRTLQDIVRIFQDIVRIL